MTPDELEYVRNTVENEGFDYSFRYGSDFDDVCDKKFHKLREAYIKASERLKEYCGCEDL